jgi:hypothetical protein
MNLKAYITTREINVQGFMVYQVTENHYNFDNIPQNSLNEIIVEDAVEYMDDIYKFLVSCCSLLRKGGTIKIFGMDLRSMCASYVSSQIDSATFSKVVVQNKRGALSVYEINDLLKKIDLDIQRSTLNDNAMYEILAIRK